MWLRVLILSGLALLVVYPFWRVTRKPSNKESNFYESQLGHPVNSDTIDSHNSGSDVGGHH
jgi:hypothetical protein